VRYLRLLSNSVAAACVATAYVLALVLHLNPMLPVHPVRLEPLVTTVGVFYAVHLTVICYMLLVVRQLFARELFSPAWISIDVLTWLCAVAAAGGAALMWANVATFGRVLDGATNNALRGTVAILAGTSALCLLVGEFRRRRPEARVVWASLLAVIVGASVAAPLAMRGSGLPPLLDAHPIDAAVDAPTPERSARVTLIALDAGSLDFITGATAEGRLPNFGRILDTGAARHLATIHPTSPEAVWAAVATGKLPLKNGVRSAGIYQLHGGRGAIQLLPDYCFAHGLVRFGFLIAQPHTSTTLRARPLWSILSAAGIPVGVVNWPLTQPAPAVRGFVVSDTYQRLSGTASDIDEPSTIYPPELQPDAAAAQEGFANTYTDGGSVVGVSLGGDPRYDSSAKNDRMYDAIAEAMSRARQVQVTFTRYQSLDPIGHYFLRYAMPSEFGDVTDEERRRLGTVLDRHYAILDETIGRAMAALGPDDLLLVVSGYGMEPLGFGKRVVERLIGDPDVSGTHEAAPDGFLMAYGASVARGRQQARASVVDIVPTILYFLGLPIGRDMDGYARTDVFQRGFTDERPITFIPTYER
jgi:predicted AlkP superfamily phosphohydrolase/phosphomutase